LLANVSSRKITGLTFARAIAQQHTGVVVFSRTGDPSIGEFHDAIILAQFGDVDLNALSE
jgi:hypothetical protein